jgi:hypothetical protein
MNSFFSTSAALKLKPFRGRAAEILKELSDKNTLEDEFLTDPAGFLSTRLHGDAARHVSRARLNSANRLLFSVMSNEKFVAWLSRYQEECLSQFDADEFAVIDKGKVRADFAKALAEFGDADIIEATLVGNVPHFGLDDPDLVFDVIGNIKGRPDLPVVSQALDMRGIGGNRGNWAADVAVEIETLVYAVAAVAVFVVAVAVVGKSARFGDRPVFRDLFFSGRELANVADALTQRANAMRARGIR